MHFGQVMDSEVVGAERAGVDLLDRAGRTTRLSPGEVGINELLLGHEGVAALAAHPERTLIRFATMEEAPLAERDLLGRRGHAAIMHAVPAVR